MNRRERLRQRWTWEPEIGEHLTSIWWSRWIILIGALLVGLAVLGWRLNVPDRYESTSRVRLIVLAGDDSSLDEDRLNLASRIYAELGDSQPIRELAVAESGTTLDIDDDSWDIEVERTSPPGFLDVTATAPSPTEATRLADGMASALAQTVSEDRLGASDPLNGLTVVPDVFERADTPSGPSAPRPYREAALAALASAIVLAELAVALRALSGRLPLTRPAERVQEMFGIATIELTGGPEDRTKLALLANRRLGPQPMAVVAQCGGWPNPAMALRLAEAIAGDDRRALVVDGDIVTPTFDSQLGVARTPGLTEVLRGDCGLGEAVQELDRAGRMSVLSVGDGSFRLTTTELNRFLASARAPRYDAIVVSLTSAAMPDRVAAGLGLGLDRSVLLVIDPTRTTRRQLRELVHAFGGHDEVDGLLLATHETATAEIRRLARRRTQQEPDPGPNLDTGPIPRPELR